MARPQVNVTEGWCLPEKDKASQGRREHLWGGSVWKRFSYSSTSQRPETGELVYVDAGGLAVQARKGYRVRDTGVSAVAARPEARLRLLQLWRALSRAVCQSFIGCHPERTL